MKTVLITGANKGIGFETAKQLARLGYFVYLGSRDLANGATAVKQLKELGLDSVEAIGINVTNMASIEKAAAWLEQQVSSLDILINNAGIAGAQPQSFSTGSLQILREVFETNFFGAVQTTRQMLPLLRKANLPSIINVSSEVGSLAVHSASESNPNRARYHMYGSSKTALNAFTIMLANELHDDQIIVNSVTPGYTATDLNQFQGTKTAEQGAKAIVKVATLTHRNITGKFFNEEGEIAW